MDGLIFQKLTPTKTTTEEDYEEKTTNLIHSSLFTL